MKPAASSAPAPAAADPETILFVYGTLRQGGSNDIARLLPSATRIAAARMRGRLFDLGPYPALVADASAAWVEGEIYDIPQHGWSVLDALEDVAGATDPQGEYFRVPGQACDTHGRLFECQVYVANPAVLRLDRPIVGGDWIDYESRRGTSP